ncbi:cytochrome c oxidase subunit II [Thermoleptolyngbya sichuanensis A183]|uniref:Cytochrome c oxidase subunit 2 n=1 Tax=Thermoleptolyngbya sichuanensis A183 TaxID=2737172 RepID=A0A6M8B6S5_9CYAN|nr:cytochrome c oxidase subunit II [Thermoleptolyngbya sichuanensis]QKD81852.1 cytochrome c oxidase subunit II [Thermoleptolyngbya sichuanensis A183]
MKQIPASLLTLTAGILITLVSLWVGQHHGLLPEQASEAAVLVDQLFNVMVMIATALFLVVIGAILLFCFRYRRAPGDEDDGIPIEGNLPLEAFWTAIPAILIIGLGVYSVQVFQEMGGFDPGSIHVGHSMIGGAVSHAMPSHEMHAVPQGSVAMMAQAPDDGAIATDATADLLADLPEGTEPPATPVPRYGFGANAAEEGHTPDLVVNVTGMQYAWLFNYPNSGIMTGELHIPVGKDIQLNISAQDVIHSFWVPQFRLKQDALPGQSSGLRFVATKVGTYPVVCAELCGSYHGGMRTQVVVHTPEEFDEWLQQNAVAQQQNPSQTVAVNPAELSDRDYLSPYAQEMGVSDQVLSQVLAQVRSRS